MSEERKHTPGPRMGNLPLRLSSPEDRGFADAEIVDSNGDHVAVCCHGRGDHYAHWLDADAIIRACNAYDALKAQNAAQREVLRKVGAILADQLVVHRLDEARDVINAALSRTKEPA